MRFFERGEVEALAVDKSSASVCYDMKDAVSYRCRPFGEQFKIIDASSMSATASCNTFCGGYDNPKARKAARTADTGYFTYITGRQRQSVECIVESWDEYTYRFARNSPFSGSEQTKSCWLWFA
jgi:hypothetical protein